jgi:hypothetical protein
MRLTPAIARAPARPSVARWSCGSTVESVPDDGDGALQRPVAVAGPIRCRPRQRRLPVRIQPSLDLPENEAEQQVAPGGLGEGTAVAAEHGQLIPGRMNAIGHGHERPENEVLRQAGRRSTHGRGEGECRRQIGIDGSEQGAILDVPREPHGIPAGTVAQEATEQLDVVVATGEDELVERLLERPHRGGECAAERPPDRADANAGRQVAQL